MNNFKFSRLKAYKSELSRLSKCVNCECVFESENLNALRVPLCVRSGTARSAVSLTLAQIVYNRHLARLIPMREFSFAILSSLLSGAAFLFIFVPFSPLSDQIERSNLLFSSFRLFCCVHFQIPFPWSDFRPLRDTSLVRFR